jgi:hypothetical protein
MESLLSFRSLADIQHVKYFNAIRFSCQGEDAGGGDFAPAGEYSLCPFGAPPSEREALAKGVRDTVSARFCSILIYMSKAPS